VQFIKNHNVADKRAALVRAPSALVELTAKPGSVRAMPELWRDAPRAGRGSVACCRGARSASALRRETIKLDRAYSEPSGPSGCASAPAGQQQEKTETHLMD
jgi:hypothetical protein